MKKLNKFHLS